MLNTEVLPFQRCLFQMVLRSKVPVIKRRKEKRRLPSTAVSPRLELQNIDKTKRKNFTHKLDLHPNGSFQPAKVPCLPYENKGHAIRPTVHFSGTNIFLENSDICFTTIQQLCNSRIL